MSIALGTRFFSYSFFEHALNNYKRDKHAYFYIADCRTLESSRKRFPQRIEKAPSELKYYIIKFRCIYGGKYKTKSRGERNTPSRRKGCPAFINLRLGNDAKHLIISGFSDVHNHELKPPTPGRKRKKYVKPSPDVTEKSEKPSSARVAVSEPGQDFFYLLTNPGETEAATNELSQIFKVVPESLSTSQQVEGSENQEILKEDQVVVLEYPENEVLHIPSQSESCNYKTDEQKSLKSDIVEMERKEHILRMEVLMLQKQVQEEKLEFNRQLQYKQLEFENEKHKKMIELYEAEISHYNKRNEAE